MLRITKNHSQFNIDVQIISDSLQLYEMGILAYYSLIGTFWQCEVDKVLRFCRLNPQYHVVSNGKGMIWNRYHPDGNVFYIAEGDDDPNYVLDRREDSKAFRARFPNLAMPWVE